MDKHFRHYLVTKELLRSEADKSKLSMAGERWLIILLDQDRLKLSRLEQAAAASGRMLDRDTAIQNRIGLIKKTIDGLRESSTIFRNKRHEDTLSFFR